MLIICTIFIASSTSAQTLTESRTDLYYNSATNQLYGVTSASIDYNTQYYYKLEIRSTLRRDQSTASFDGWSNTGSYAETHTGTTVISGSSYEQYNSFYLNIEYQTYEILAGCSVCYDWYDPFDYSYISQKGDLDSWGPTFSVWLWSPPVIAVRAFAQLIELGDSGAAAQLPAPKRVFSVKVRSFIPPKMGLGT